MAEGTSTESYDDSDKKAVLKLMENIAHHNPEMAVEITVEALFEETKMKIMSEKSDIEKNIENINIEYAQKKVEFDTYLKLFERADRDHDLRLKCALLGYIKKKHGEAYVNRLFMRHSYEGK